MKRKLIPTTALAVMLALGGLVACGENPGEDNPGGEEPGQQEPAEEVKITITAADGKKSLVKGDTAETVQLTASVEGVIWTSAKPEVATVSETGLVTAVGKGSTTIKATKEGCKDGTISISVTLEKIEVNAPKNKLLLEEEMTVTANKAGVTWSSSDETVASVDANGKVKGLKYGTTTIKAEKDGYDAGSVSVTVDRADPIAVLHLEDAEHHAANGVWGSTSSYSSSSYTTPVYEKSTASDGTCLAHFRAGDKETLTFTSDKAIAAEVCVTVGSSSSKSDLSACFTAKVNGVAADLTGVAYESIDSSSYTFDPISLGNHTLVAGENKVEIEFVGSSNPYIDEIKIYSKDTSAKIEVVKAAAMQEFALTSESSVTIEQGKTSQITSEVTGLRYASSSSNATVNETGLITGVNVGSANITVWKEGYIAQTVKVTVTEKVVEGSITVEAENAVASSEAITFRTPSSSASGDVINAWPQNESLTFTFEAPEAGTYDLVLNSRGIKGSSYSYAECNGTTDLEISVNGTVVAFAGSVSGSSFKSFTLGSFEAVAGANTIIIKALNEAGGPMLDYIKLVPSQGTPGGEGGDTPVVHTHAWVAGTEVANANEAKYAIDTCDCGKDRINLNVASDLNGKITKKGGKLGSNGDTAKYVFTCDATTKAHLMIKGTYDNANNGQYGFYTGKNGGSTAVTLDDGKTNTTIKLNGTEIALPTDKTYTELGMTGTNEAGCAIIDLGEVTLNDAASNELTITRNDSFAIQYFEVYFEYEHVAKNFKTYSYAEVLAAKTGGTEITTSGVDNLLKLGTANDCVTLTYNASAAGKCTLRVLCANKTANIGQKMYGSNGTKFTVTVNGTAQEMPSNQTSLSMKDLGMTTDAYGGGDYCVPVWIDFCELNLVEGDNTIVFTYTGGGYSLAVQSFALAK